MLEYQESISLPRQQSHSQNISDVTILELWILFKSLQLPGKGLDGKSQLISILTPSVVAATQPYPPPPPAESYSRISRAD